MIHSLDLPDDVQSMAVICRLKNGAMLISTPAGADETIKAQQMIVEAADLLCIAPEDEDETPEAAFG